MFSPCRSVALCLALIFSVNMENKLIQQYKFLPTFQTFVRKPMKKFPNFSLGWSFILVRA